MSEDPVQPLKQQLAREIVRLTDGWSQWNAACLLDIDQPRMSNLRRDKLNSFSLDRLVLLLSRLRCRVEITITQQKRSYNQPPEKPAARNPETT